MALGTRLENTGWEGGSDSHCGHGASSISSSHALLEMHLAGLLARSMTQRIWDGALGSAVPPVSSVAGSSLWVWGIVLIFKLRNAGTVTIIYLSSQIL
jgi:hypothetical protein